MKRAFWILAIFFFLPSLTQAQSFHLDMVRTLDVPGFFMVRITPENQNVALPTQDLFVKNFLNQDETLYESLFSLIEKDNGKIIEKTEVAQYQTDPSSRFIFLGNPGELGVNFHIQNKDQAAQEFQSFITEYLGPVYLRNITLDTGGNIHDILPSFVSYAGDKPIVFVGKFDKEMKTRFQVNGTSFDGALQATQILHLEDKSFSEDPLSDQLPDLWESLWNAEHQSSSSTEENLSWKFLDSQNIFPGILFLFGVFFFVLFIRQMRRRSLVLDPVDMHSLELNSFPETKVPHEEDVPFEIEKRKPISAINSDVPFSLVSHTQKTPPSLKKENRDMPVQDLILKAPRSHRFPFL